MSATAPKVFVSYRRRGTAVHAGRLYDALADRFGEHNVFMDLEMAPGIDFVERITSAVDSCRVALVVMGPDWAGDGDGRSRLSDPQDFVRLEVQSALNAPGVTVIPVLVAGAAMPEPEELPAGLRPLTRRNAIELSDLRWRYDCTRLMTALDELLGAEQPVELRESAPRPSGAGARTLLPLWLEGVVLATGAGMLARLLAEPIRAAEGATDMAHVVATMARRGLVWAVVGVALAIWLSLRRGEQGRLPQRIVMGLLLGALAGAAGGAIYGAALHLPAERIGAAAAERVAIVALATTGGIVGAAIGALWIPPRVVVGLLGGAVGGALATLGMNAFSHPDSDVIAFGIDCFAIVGVALLAMLALDVRAATTAARPAAAPEAARV